MKISIALILVFAGLSSCRKYKNMKACFTMDKDIAVVGDTITFFNCSNYDGYYESATWRFGDGPFEGSLGFAPIKHVYAAPGKYIIEMSIGGPHHNSIATDTVTIQ